MTDTKFVRIASGEVAFSKSQPLYLWTTCDVFHGDWKCHSRELIPKGTKITVEDVMTNYYGTWIETTYDGRYYSIDPKCLEYRFEDKIYPPYIRKQTKVTQCSRCGAVLGVLAIPDKCPECGAKVKESER